MTGPSELTRRAQERVEEDGELLAAAEATTRSLQERGLLVHASVVISLIEQWSHWRDFGAGVPALLDRLTEQDAKIRELEESRGIERVVHAIQEQQLREAFDKAPRWDDDPIVIEHDWLSGRCGRCGEALPAALVDPVDATAPKDGTDE